MNVQLYAYETENNADIRYELDLYPEQPIKITLSAEEITDPTQVNSTFSRQFRIPATNNNSKFFRYWYTSGVLDFDVTQKITSDIYVDGIRYTTGQLRLIGAYQNDTEDRIDFEVVFLGETKTFSSQVGDQYMNALDCIDTAHVLTTQYVEESWIDPWNAVTIYDTGEKAWSNNEVYESLQDNNQGNLIGNTAFWQIQQGGPRTNPEFLRYVVAMRGGNYDDTGNLLAVPGQSNPSEVAVDGSACTQCPESHTNAFTKSAHPIFLTQFTPIVQVKYLIDKIFEATNYSYTDDSEFNQEWFKDLYIDGIATGFPFTPAGDGLFNATKGIQYDVPSNQTLIYPVVNQNNANSYNGTTGIYTIPSSGIYTFNATIRGRQPFTDPNNDPYVTLGIYRNGTEIASSTQVGVEGTPNFFDFIPGEVTYTGNFTAGQEITVRLNSFYGDADVFGATQPGDNTFSATLTPSQISTNDMLKTDLKQIDWFRSILTKFRMVMVPTVADANQFTIKPWQDYIGSGEEFDWTYKLDHNKDIKLEPLFYNQQADITFTDQEDIDVTNKYQQDTFASVYGRRLFVSGNELLSGTREIETEFAPTPVSQIEGLRDIDTQFIIPKFYENGDELSDHGHVQHIPITPVQRLLFWNGLQPTTTNIGTHIDQQITWYYTDGNNLYDSSNQPLEKDGIYRYPRCSYLTEIPTTNTTFNLNWKTQFSYFGYLDTNGDAQDTGTLGESVYDRYWAQYIANQYSPQARKMTAYFNLTSEDLRTLTFDDTIFIKDAYWRIQKVYDAPLGEVATVKVELIKLLVSTSGNPTPPPVGQYEYNVQFCNGQGQAWVTSPDPNIAVGTIMRANVVDDLTGNEFLECVTVGQQQDRPQGGDSGAIIGSITYTDCQSC